MDLIVVAGLTLVTVVAAILAIWWVVASRGVLRARLAAEGPTPMLSLPTVLRTPAAERFSLLARAAATLPVRARFERLMEQAGWAGRSGEVLALMIIAAVGGGVLGGARTGERLWAILCAIAGATLPLCYLRYRGQKRIEKFTEQFPDALDMMTRSLRAGYALGASIQLVAEEMPDPVGPEFKRVFEEISLGRPPTEVLLELYRRIETEDIGFFYSALSIQREVGGNLAEILDSLSHVIRERYKLLSYARVLSAQQKASANLVAVSPFVMAIMFSMMSPGFFEPLFRWQYGNLAILGALVLQGIGFLILRRIANIKV